MHEELLQRLDALGDNDHDFEIELIQIFLSELKKNLDALDEASQRGDRETAARVSHSLKGSALNVGAKEFSELCEQLERKLRNHSDDPQLRAAMIQEYHSLDRVLKARIKTLQSS